MKDINRSLVSMDSKYYSYSDFNTNMNRHGVSWFKFDEPSGNVTDSKGSAIGTVTGATRVVGWNDEGRALNFNGLNNFVTFSDRVIPIGATSIRFKIKTNGNEQVRILGTTAGTGAGIIFTYMGHQVGKNLNIHLNNGAINGSFNVPFIIGDNQWHDVLFTWDGTTNAGGIKIYIDKTNIFTFTAITVVSSHTNNMRIGANSNSASLFFNGQLDNLEIYNSAIDPNPKLIDLSNKNTINNFISYGLENGDTVDLESKIDKVQYINGSNTILGSGKVFKQKIDTSETPIKSASIT